MESNHLLVIELASIAYKRNQIESKRRKAKSKRAYYVQQKNIVYAHMGYSMKLKALQSKFEFMSKSTHLEDRTKASELLPKIQYIQASLAFTKNYYPFPKKWFGKLSELNKLILKHEADYVKAKYEQARHTSKTKNKVAKLLKALNFKVSYDNGKITFFGKQGSCFSQDQFESLAKEFEANKAIERIING